MIPCIKWIGGKRQLLSVLTSKIPDYNVYFEPFVGGGSLILNLSPKKAYIFDVNAELINMYMIIKTNVHELMKDLDKHKNEKEYYLNLVKQENLNNIQRASRFIFLNKTCYGGLYRVNKKGKFNAAFGNHKNPLIYSKENLLEISSYLNNNNVSIICDTYKKVLDCVNKNDFVYFDPPYYPLDDSKELFKRYNQNTFNKQNQVELSETFKVLDKMGVHVMLSNSNSDFIKELYKDYNLIEIQANRLINADTKNRNKQKVEILVRNF